MTFTRVATEPSRAGVLGVAGREAHLLAAPVDAALAHEHVRAVRVEVAGCAEDVLAEGHAATRGDVTDGNGSPAVGVAATGALHAEPGRSVALLTVHVADDVGAGAHVRAHVDASVGPGTATSGADALHAHLGPGTLLIGGALVVATTRQADLAVLAADGGASVGGSPALDPGIDREGVELRSVRTAAARHEDDGREKKEAALAHEARVAQRLGGGIFVDGRAGGRPEAAPTGRACYGPPMQLYVGANLERPPGRKYVEALPFAELTFPSSLPKPKTLGRWREGVPESFRVAIVAPPAAIGPRRSPLRPTDEAAEALSWLTEAVETLDADVVVPTGSGLTTSKRDRERLAAFIDRLPRREGRHIVWAPQGLWEAELAHPAAEDLGVLCAFDPLEDPAPEGPVLYARVAAIGARRRLGEGVRYELLDALMDAAPQQAFIALESARSFDAAVALQQLALGG